MNTKAPARASPAQPRTVKNAPPVVAAPAQPALSAVGAVVALSALAQESRLAVFRLLVESGPAGLPAGEIAERLGIANTTLSFHLKELTHAGLIHPTQRGRFVIYAPDFGRMNALVAFLTDNCCGGAGGCGPLPAAAGHAR